jgi:hypothetical protein
MNAASRAIVHERLRQVITELIAEDVGQAKREKIPLDLLIKHVASSFVVVLDWWVESESTLSPAEVDALFRQLVLPSLAAALD